MIAPLPYVVALNTVMLIEHVLVFAQPAGTVAHRMGVFADNPRLGMRIFPEFVHQRYAGIHGGDDIHHLRVAILFVMHQPGIIDRFRGVIHRANVAAVAGLVAQRPDDDRRMVFLRVDVAHDPLNVNMLPCRVIGDGAKVADVGEAVGFDIGFRHHEQAVNVAHLIETRVVGVVGGTYRVDIVLLHQQQIFLNAIHPYGAALQMVVVVTVNAVEHHVAVIDIEQAVAHFDIAKTDALRDNFDNLPGGVFQRHHQVIEPGIFCRPLLRRLHVDRKVDVQQLADAQARRCTFIQYLFAVEQRVFQRRCVRLRGEIFQHQLAGERGVDVVIVKIGAQSEVLDVKRVFAHQIHVAEDTRRPPHILIFYIGGVRPLHDAHAKQVVADFYRVTNIKLRRQAAAFAETDVLTVNVHFKIGFDAIKFNQGLLALPALAEGKDALIGAGRVVGRHVGNVNRERKAFVGVL